MATAAQTFRPYHTHDRAFFLVMAAAAWAAILSGFGPELYQHGRGVSPFPAWIVLVHGAAFFGWLILFTLQVWLIRSRRLALHRSLGLIAFALAPTMVVLGLVANTAAQRGHFLAGQSQLNFMIVPIIDMVNFGALAGFGLALRKRPAAHKRLMLLATICLLDAGFGRTIGTWMLPIVGDGFWGFMAQLFLGYDLMIVIAMLYDQATRGRVHPVYWVALPLLLVNQLLASALYHAPGWIPVARWLIS